MMATKGLGSTVVLNVLLWLSLVISIPLAGFHPIYVTVAATGAVILLAIAALAFGFIRGAERASRILHASATGYPACPATAWSRPCSRRRNRCPRSAATGAPWSCR